MPITGLSITTQCASTDEFVCAYSRHCDATSLFVATTDRRAIGTRVPFAIFLTDRTAILRGWCNVDDGTVDPRTPGLRLVFETMPAACRQTLLHMQSLRIADRLLRVVAKLPPPKRPRTVTIPPLTSATGTSRVLRPVPPIPTVPMRQIAIPPLPTRIARGSSAACASPLAQISERAIEAFVDSAIPDPVSTMATLAYEPNALRPRIWPVVAFAMLACGAVAALGFTL